MTREEYMTSICEVKTKKFCFRGKLKINTMVLSTQSCLNVGNMIRTANLTGVNTFIIYGNRKYDKRSAMTAYSSVDIVRVTDKPLTILLSDDDYVFDKKLFVKTLQENNMYPIFVEQDKKSVFLEDCNWKEVIDDSDELKPCLIFGNERVGIPKNILATKSLFPKSFIVQMRQVGNVNSYNVSNAYAIILNNVFERNVKMIKDKYGLF